jgi:hypothetical protein
MHQLFGERMDGIIGELHEALVAREELHHFVTPLQGWNFIRKRTQGVALGWHVAAPLVFLTLVLLI